MKIVCDVTNVDFFLALFNENYELIDYVFEKNLNKKVEYLPKKMEEILSEHSLKFNSIKEVYISNGPGYFTGIRTGLTYFAALSQFNNFKIYTSNSFIFLNPKSKKIIDARGGYVYELNNDNQIILKEAEDDNYPNMDYEFFVKNFKELSKKFNYENNTVDIKSNYIKKPQIGVKKW
ncbi:glycoprotease family protein [Mycoplasma testudineum]|uniref:Glycoprotease family protein n=1 Tax=Mycoplasma testudineum TaxID=244584 RepID=A0A4V3C2M8_9MOLU|nr:hypothetical protein [Mycoplasma testudineum]OYD26468.1 hypothetical protein CG473_03710 [Mycoplasma testudineum]TDO18969.1 glycoprotease family protein [Mycoplasma testudineum]